MNTGFREGDRVRIQVPAGGPWSFLVDDEPLTVDDGAWSWAPEFFAGEVTAQLLGPDARSAAEYVLDVSPDPAKLGRERFRDMLREVVDEDPLLVAGDEPSKLRLGADARLDDPFAVLTAFARLRVYAKPLVNAVDAAAHQPRTSTCRARALVPMHRARHIDVQSVRVLARSAALALIAPRSTDDPAMPPGARPLVDVPLVETTVDCAANRCAVALVQLVRQRARLVRERLPALHTRLAGTEVRSGLAARLPRRLCVLEEIELATTRLLREHPWCEVTRGEITAAGLIALAADPLYARVQQLAWKALRTGLHGAASDDSIWLSPTWEIFERWCFVRLGALLRSRLPHLAWCRDTNAGSVAIWEGTAAGERVRLLLQPRFRSWDQGPTRGGFQSVSRERCPDLVLTIERGAYRWFFALDAKYSRTRASVLQQMESAHVYHDSLRWDGQRPQLALLVVPAIPEVEWLCDEAFQREQRVGAFVLNGRLPAPIEQALSALSSYTPQPHVAGFTS